MADFWQTFGRLLADFWQTFGRLLADLKFREAHPKCASFIEKRSNMSIFEELLAEAHLLCKRHPRQYLGGVAEVLGILGAADFNVSVVDTWNGGSCVEVVRFVSVGTGEDAQTECHYWIHKNTSFSLCEALVNQGYILRYGIVGL